MRPDDLRTLLMDGRIAQSETDMLERFLQDGNLDNSYTGLLNGTVIACVGAVVIWPGRAEAWAVVSTEATRWDMLWLTQRIREALPEVARRLELRRLEATVLADWEPGRRWAEILGFSPVTLLQQYDPAGRDHRSYVKLWLRSQSSSPLHQPELP